MIFEITAEPKVYTCSLTQMLFTVTRVDALAVVVPPVIPTPIGVLINEDGSALINEDGSSLITD
jgi:hypothetical protein